MPFGKQHGDRHTNRAVHTVQSGVQRLKALSLDNHHRCPLLPTVLLLNIQSIGNKIDELEAWAKYKWKIKETGLLACTKIWLGENDWGEDLYFSRFNSQLQLERLVEITGKR